MSGIQSALTAVKTKITDMAGFSDNNVSVGDEAVFAYIQTTAGAQPKCCIVEYGGFTDRDRSEFRSYTLEWRVFVNAFFMIEGTDYINALSYARAFVDDFIVALAADQTLSKFVLSVKPVRGSEPMAYARSNYEYILVTVELAILDNIQ